MPNSLWDPERVEVDSAAIANETDAERRRAAAMFAGPILYGYAVADGSIVLRTGHRLYCVRDRR